MGDPKGGAVWDSDPASLVDLDRYALVDGAWGAAVADARAGLRERGLAELPGFVAPAALPVLVGDAERLAPLAWRDCGSGTAYLDVPDLSMPVGHPRRWTGPRALGAVAYDLFPADSPLRALYEWDPLLRFVEAVLDRGTLHRYADECGALNLAVMGAGDQLQWHFDMTDFVVSLALRDAQEGGEFEVAPRLRSAEDECYDAVAAVLAGGSSAAPVVTLGMTPGTLLLFEGRHSLHRVTEVRGPTARWVGLLSYDTRPGTRGSDRLRRVRYGRA